MPLKWNRTPWQAYLDHVEEDWYAELTRGDELRPCGFWMMESITGSERILVARHRVDPCANGDQLTRTNNKRLRISFAVPHFPEFFPGGAEIQSYFIARHMVERGWSVHFVTEDRGRRPAAVESLNGICIHNLRGVRFFNPIKCWRFYRELLRINADVYYQRGGTEYTFATYLAARTLGKKFVWATAVRPDCEGKKFRRSLREEGAKGIKRVLLMPDAWMRDALISLGRRGADTIVVQDQSQYQEMKETFGREAIVIRSGHPIPAAPIGLPQALSASEAGLPDLRQGADGRGSPHRDKASLSDSFGLP